MNFPFNRCKRPIFTRYMDYMMSSICPLFFCGGIWGVTKLIQHPIPSRYDIFTYSWLIFVVNARKYTIHWSYLPLWLHKKNARNWHFVKITTLPFQPLGRTEKPENGELGLSSRGHGEENNQQTIYPQVMLASKLSNFDVLNCPQRKNSCLVFHYTSLLHGF